MSDKSMTEKELIEGIIKGDKIALKSFVSQYKDLVFRVCYSVVQNKDDADDLAQEVFIKAFHHATGFRNDAKISTWLYRIALNLSINFIKSKKKKSFVDFVDHIVFKSTEQAKPEVEQMDYENTQEKKYKILYNSIQQLPVNQQKAFLLHHQEGLSYYEIAEVMQTSHAAVESLIHRAKVGLKQKLIKELKKQNLFESYQ
ncbi:MAG TPA: RNA polymerase sigma factor [Bacteroidia bacterium]|nr:RNA polymerase sigma factor [Bacteroidia bacterium]HRS57884.1 RNA polymerase sigma factor [Bacteroidia bacterium]HRU68476.1 RNA polymerase sigma factor [Bacteroidia bacterium]